MPLGCSQHPLQMLSVGSISLCRRRTVSWEDKRRSSRRDKVAVRPFTRATIRVALGEGRLEITGGADGTTGADMFGEGGGGILAALPMPLGSLIELLTPPALPGPCGTPLTPASCASKLIGALKPAANTSAKKADLPNIGHSPVKSA